jgi:DnaK suppressor protein
MAVSPEMSNLPDRVNNMSVELPPDYQPSASEDYMNPAQIEYFRRKLRQSRTALQRELEAIPHIEPGEIADDGDQTDQARRAALNLASAINAVCYLGC